MFKFPTGLLFLAALLNSQVVALPSNSTSTSKPTSDTIKPETVNLVPVGNVAIVQASTGDSRLYYQNSAGDIVECAVNGPFNTGHSENSGNPIAPASQVLSGSPIAAISVENFAQIRLYFFSSSPEDPDTLGEVDNNGSEWVFALLPN